MSDPNQSAPAKKFSFKPVNTPAAPAATAESSAPAASTTPAPSAPVEVVSQPLPTVVGAPSTAVAIAQPAPGAVTERAAISYGDDSEDTDAGDIILPRINIVQKVGDLSNVFTEGDIVFNKTLVIHKSPKPAVKDPSKFLRVVFCGFRKDRFVEKTVGGKLGKIVDSELQVVANGGTTNWNQHKSAGTPLYQTLAEAMILIEKPEGIDDPAFNITADGKEYAIAVYSMKGTAFTNGAKIVRTARKIGWLADSKEVKRGYPFGIWKLGAELKSFDGGTFAWAPLLSRDCETGPELREIAARVCG